MSKVIKVRSGEKVKIIQRFLSSVPVDYHFYASALDGGQPDGTVEIRGSDWIFPKTPIIQPLRKQNVVHAGFWDTFFTVSVIAHGEMEIATPRRISNLNFWVLLAVIGIAVVSVAAILLAQ